MAGFYYSSPIPGSRGTAAQPYYNFIGDLGTGLYSPGAGQLAFSLNGTNRFQVGSGGETIHNVDSASAAVRITQIGTGYSLLVEDSANPDSSPFVIDSNGAVAIGSLSPGFTYGFGPIKVAIEGTGSDAFFGLNRYAANSAAPGFVFAKSRGATVGARASIISGDNIGELSWRADDGVNWVTAASIIASVDGTPGTNDMPGRIGFFTTLDGTSSAVERMRIDNEGKVGIGVSPQVGQSFAVGRNITGATGSVGILSSGVIQSGVTSFARAFDASISTAAASFSLTSATHFYANGLTIGSGSSVTNQYGFFANSGISGGTNNFGFYSDIAASTNRWNFYANGTAGNYFAGNVSIGTTTVSSALTVNGFITENPGDGVYWNIVSQKDVGFAPNQIPLNQFLGQMAFVDQHYPSYAASSSTADAAISLDASSTERYSHIASFTADRTLQISNLVPKKEMTIYLRNTNASARVITIQASVTTSSFSNVNLAPGTGSGAASVSTVTLAANTGTAVVWVSNIDGNIVGGLF